PASGPVARPAYRACVPEPTATAGHWLRQSPRVPANGQHAGRRPPVAAGRWPRRGRRRRPPADNRDVRIPAPAADGPYPAPGPRPTAARPAVVKWYAAVARREERRQ